MTDNSFREGIRKLSETHVTKNEFESFKQQVFKRFDSVATKDDLKKLATKDELKKLATKSELKKLATKDELKKVDQKVDRVITAVVNIQHDLTKFETKADADRRFDLLMQAIDGLAGRIDDYMVEKAATDHALTRHDNLFEDHEKRIKNLETNIA